MKLQSTSQSQTCTKKGHGHCLVICCPSDSLQLSESWWKHYIWEVCSANQWDALKTKMPAASTSQQNEPKSQRCLTACHTTNVSKVEWIGLWSFASSAIFTWPLANWLPLTYQLTYQFFKHLNNFLQGKRFHNQQEAENAFQESVKSRSRFLSYTNKQTYFSLAKSVDCNGSYFDW